MSYISRDGILKDLQEALEVDSIYYNDDVNKGITEGLKLAIKNIKRFPTSDVVEVRHGKWYKHDKKKHGDTCYYCSVCEKMALADCMVWELTDYCPHCGSKMDGERREE